MTYIYIYVLNQYIDQYLDQYIFSVPFFSFPLSQVASSSGFVTFTTILSQRLASREYRGPHLLVDLELLNKSEISYLIEWKLEAMNIQTYIEISSTAQEFLTSRENYTDDRHIRRIMSTQSINSNFSFKENVLQSFALYPILGRFVYTNITFRWAIRWCWLKFSYFCNV